MKNKTPAIRMCIGCREKKLKKELIRIVKAPDGSLMLDEKGKASGRGAYICPCRSCMEKALKIKAIERNLEVIPSEEIKAALVERISEIEKSINNSDKA
ncbi:MAG: YlxR family protein [Clostridiales bacterium]|nr:YlxR family protein [Clostridiales bacterium]